MQLSSDLLKILVCPVTKGPLVYDVEAQELISLEAGLAYPVKNGIPMLLADHARRVDKAVALSKETSTHDSDHDADDVKSESSKGNSRASKAAQKVALKENVA